MGYHLYRIALAAAFVSATTALFGCTSTAPIAPAGGSQSSSFFDVRAFGARGDGKSDDTAAIAAAVAAAGKRGGTAYVPAGVYLIYPREAVFPLASGVTVTGDGAASVLKVGNAAGRYNLIFGQIAGHIANVALRNLRVDQNPGGNRSSNVNPITDAENVVQLYNFDRVTIDKVDFEPESGVQAIVLAGPRARDATVENCRFAFVRGHSSNPYYDNSSVYTEAAGIAIENNVFTSKLEQNAVTAIEIHGGPGALIAGNRTQQFQIGLNAVDSTAGYPARDANFRIERNRFLDIAEGVNLWSIHGRTLRYVTIANNLFTMSSHELYAHTWLGVTFVAGNVGNPSLDGGFDRIAVSGNTFDFGALHRQHVHPHEAVGIDFEPQGPATNLSAQDNRILESPAAGIHLGSARLHDDLADTVVDGNTIVDAGWSTVVPPVERVGLKLDRARLRNVHADSNTLRYSPGARDLSKRYSFWATPLDTSHNVTLRNDIVLPQDVLRHRVDTRLVDDSGTVY